MDENATVHDFYFPYVGLDNLSSARGLNHKVGIWVDNEFSWVDDGSWQVDTDFEEDALISKITARNEHLGVSLHFQDFVDTRYPVFCRMIDVENHYEHNREIRLFMHQAFQISRGGRSDTAMYVPGGNYLLDYKGWASLLIYGQNEETGSGFDQFAVGNCGIEGKEGTFRDAEDGELSGSPIEHGGVDSVIRIKLDVPGASRSRASYWIVASDSQFDAEAVHHILLSKGVASRLESTRQAFADWLEVATPHLSKLKPEYQTAAKKSLLVVKSHIDKHGGIIASCDSSIYNYGRDYYSYVWPRDGAFTILPLIEMGFQAEPKKFFEFCTDTIHPNGYMMHKYQPDRSVGSTWHPQMHKNHPELPIQEDETAIVIYALGRYLEVSKDEDFVRQQYAHLVKPAADFMAKFIDDATNLPHASYDLWEERFATHTYSTAVTIAGLEAAVRIGAVLGYQDEQTWVAALARLKEGFKLFYDPDKKCFRKSIFLEADGNLTYDNTLDISSMYGPFIFANLDKELLDQTVQTIENLLLDKSPSGGTPRYEHDNYFLTKAEYLGNPWIITTLWIAQYYLANGRKDEAIRLIDWTLSKAIPSGMLAEQVDPETSQPTGVSPLVWSHSTLAETLFLLNKSS
jgi:GH15 family glucan-1,4-alpha-glucosidase